MLWHDDEILDKWTYKDLFKLKLDCEHARDMCVGWLYRDILNDDVIKIKSKLDELEKSMKSVDVYILRKQAYSEFNNNKNEL